MQRTGELLVDKTRVPDGGDNEETCGIRGLRRQTQQAAELTRKVIVRRYTVRAAADVLDVRARSSRRPFRRRVSGGNKCGQRTPYQECAARTDPLERSQSEMDSRHVVGGVTVR